MDEITKLWAMWYDEVGLEIFPCLWRDKVPLVRWRERSYNKDVLESKSEINFGVKCGRDGGGLVVLDFDDYIDFVKTMKSDILNETLVVRSGGGGVHVYMYVYGGRVSKTTLRPAIKCDVQGEGAYVIGAGSMHKSGARYVQISTTRDIMHVTYESVIALIGKYRKAMNRYAEMMQYDVVRVEDERDLPPCVRIILNKYRDTGIISHEERLIMTPFLLYVWGYEKVKALYERYERDFDQDVDYYLRWLAEHNYIPPACLAIREKGLCVRRCEYFPFMIKRLEEKKDMHK